MTPATDDLSHLPVSHTPANEADFIHAQVDRALQQADTITDAEAVAPTDKKHTEDSPWLALTRWPE